MGKSSQHQEEIDFLRRNVNKNQDQQNHSTTANVVGVVFQAHLQRYPRDAVQERTTFMLTKLNFFETCIFWHFCEPLHLRNALANWNMLDEKYGRE